MKFKIFIISMLHFICTNGSNAQNVKPREFGDNDEIRKMLDLTKPLFINGNVSTFDVGANVVYSCLISPYSPKLRAGFFIYDSEYNQKNDRSGAYALNLPIRDIFLAMYGTSGHTDPISDAYYGPLKLSRSNCEMRNIDTTKLVGTLNGKFVPENGWNVQLTSTVDVPEVQIRKQIIGAVEQQFGLETFLEKQTKKCVVFSRNHLPLPQSNEGPTDGRMGNNSGKAYMSTNNIPMDRFIERIRDYFFFTNYPIIDETGFTGQVGKVNFTIDKPAITFDDLAKELAKFGIRVTIEERAVDILVITKVD